MSRAAGARSQAAGRPALSPCLPPLDGVGSGEEGPSSGTPPAPGRGVPSSGPSGRRPASPCFSAPCPYRGAQAHPRRPRGGGWRVPPFPRPPARSS